MKIKEWLRSATSALDAKGVSTARLDSLVLLSYITQKPKSWILANLNEGLSNNDLEELNKLLERRKSREPLAYLTNEKEFYGYSFYVDSRVMIPRPETEELIDYVKQDAPEGCSLLEVGTGSGAIALTLGKERPDINILAVDTSLAALQVARMNQKRLDESTVAFQQSDLLTSVSESFEFVVANLPYVARSAEITDEASFEPSVALFAEKEGTAIYERLFAELTDRKKFETLVLEAEPFQKNALQAMAKDNGYKLYAHNKMLLYVFKKCS